MFRLEVNQQESVHIVGKYVNIQSNCVVAVKRGLTALKIVKN